MVGDNSGVQSAGASFAVTSGAQGKDHTPSPGQHLQFCAFVKAAFCNTRLDLIIIAAIVRATPDKLLRAICIVKLCKLSLGCRGPPIGLVLHTLTPPTVVFRPKLQVIANRKSERSPKIFLQLCGIGKEPDVDFKGYFGLWLLQPRFQ